MRKNILRAGVVLIFGLAIPGFIVAATDPAVLRSQIETLLKQVQMLQSELSRIETPQTSTAGNPPFCYDFTITLKLGSRGVVVASLHKALQAEGFLISEEEVKAKNFGESTASAVSGFQERNATEILVPNNLSYGNGFVGPSTRGLLNRLHGCKSQKIQTPLISPLPPVTSKPSPQVSIAPLSTVSPPVISSVSPNPVKAGGTLNISGFNFSDSFNCVWFKGSDLLACYAPSLNASTSIVVGIPATLKGTYEVFVEKGGLPDVYSNGVILSVISAVTVPVITQINPIWGPPDTQVEISGTGFTTTMNRVIFTSVADTNSFTVAARIPSASGKLAPFALPTIPSGNYKVFVENPNGYSAAAPNQFVVASYVTSITPNSGTPGASVTVQGSGFSPNNIVSFMSGNIFASRLYNVPSSDGKTLTFKVPQLNPGTYQVNVSSYYGLTKNVPFTVTAEVDNSGGSESIRQISAEILTSFKDQLNEINYRLQELLNQVP